MSTTTRTDDEAIARKVEDIVRAHLLRLQVGELPEGDISLLRHGAGLDSIALVELLFECETTFEISISHDLFSENDVTLNRLIQVVQDAVHNRVKVHVEAG
jgi:acyl carrier protein